MFYLKLALQNIRNSIRVFAPFVLASLVLFTIISSMFGLMFSPVMTSMGSGAVTLGLGLFVLTIFSLIMEIYSYNFLMQQRSREFGLYNVLGMNKKKVTLIATLELTVLFLVILFIGSILGTVFSNVLYLIFVNLVGYSDLHFGVDPLAFIYSGFIFAGIFLILEFLAIRKIGKTNPLILFRSSEKGEKEPKGNLLLASLGVLSLGAGYYLSLSSKAEGVGVIYLFFIAVLLVIAGTYLFYISFMTWFLRRRRKNKRYFYQPEHFITTSQMIFRMKQHATGLANITLLAVMSFVTIATTTSLYTGMQGVLDESHPRSAAVDYTVENRSQGETYFQESVLNYYPESNQNSLNYLSLLNYLPYEGGEEIVLTEDSYQNLNPNKILNAYFVTQEDYRKLGNQISNLQENQIALMKPREQLDVTKLTLGDKIFEVTETYSDGYLPDAETTAFPIVVIVSNDQILEEFKDFFQSRNPEDSPSPLKYNVYADLNKEQIEKIASQDGDLYLLEDQNGEPLGTVLMKETYETMILGFIGGFLFTGFLLGISFLLGAALIIYYKQYSEGHEDKKSYKILQEVGMSAAAVKKTINSQILLVFFMPLGMATLHFVVSLVMLRQMLAVFGIYSSSLIYLISGITLLVITVMYFAIYKLTSRTYYRIIER